MVSSVSSPIVPWSSALRRERPYLERAAPVLKWAGGKTRLLPEILPRLPPRLGRYHEPFFGGGALFFRLQPRDASLSDANEELITVYRSVRDDVERLIVELGRHRYEREYYYGMRALDPADLSDIERAARTIYLNRTCFNGLYRVNRRGQFNVPMGSYANPVICQADRLRAVSELLRHVDVRQGDYASCAEEAREGDFVYFDPPYQPISKTASFTSYTANDFGEADQAALADTFRGLTDRGVRCLLSNSDTPLIRELYEGFQVEAVLAPRAISRNGAGRRAVLEVLVRNY